MSNLISKIHFPHHLEGLELNLAMSCIKDPRGIGDVLLVVVVRLFLGSVQLPWDMVRLVVVTPVQPQ